MNVAMYRSSSNSPSRSARLLLAGVALSGVCLLGWMIWVGTSTADSSEAQRRATWASYAARFDEAADAARTHDALRSVSGAVLDSSDRGVPHSRVVLVNLDALQEVSGSVDLETAIPAECIEAATTADAQGAYQFKNVSVGPKTVLAEHEGLVSFPRVVCRVYDGVPTRAFDVRLLPTSSLHLVIAGGAAGAELECSPVFAEQYLSASDVGTIVDGACTLSIPSGASPAAVLIRETRSRAARVVPVDTLQGNTIRVHAGFVVSEHTAPDVPDGRYVCTVDDLTSGIADLCQVPVIVRGGIAEVPHLGGSIGVTLHAGDQVHHARIEDGEGAFAYVGRSADAVELVLPPKLRDVRLRSGYACLSRSEPVVGFGEDRLALVRRGRRPMVEVAGSAFRISRETATRFRHLRFVTEAGRVLRGITEGSGKKLEVSVDALTGGTCSVRLPWAYTWCRLVADDGTVLVRRAGAAAVVRFERVPLGTPFVVQSSDGPYGWNQYAVKGGHLSDASEELSIVVPRSSKRPMRSPQAEVTGFVTGPTTASSVRVFLQPDGDPRGTRLVECEESPFYGFSASPGRGYTVIAWPENSNLGDDVSFLKSTTYVPRLAEGETRRADVRLEAGVVRIRAPGLLRDRWVALVRTEDERTFWQWQCREATELRNVPMGEYKIIEATESGTPELLAPPFTVEGPEPVLVELRQQ